MHLLRLDSTVDRPFGDPKVSGHLSDGACDARELEHMGWINWNGFTTGAGTAPSIWHHTASFTDDAAGTTPPLLPPNTSSLMASSASIRRPCFTCSKVPPWPSRLAWRPVRFCQR